ncbi:MAG: hypothetical protein C4575_00615 [Desulforudis sp.]|jgi:hypothetical protein|nr:MAG: hypothetical protein C4575_00615 [Desulforudis sp.]
MQTPPEYAVYLNGLRSTFREYLQERFPPYAIDLKKGEGYVFTKQHELLNIFDPHLAFYIPPERRHQWFHSMASSQALTLSVLDTIARRGDLGLLGGLICDNSRPLLTPGLDPWFHCFEFTPWWLEKGERKSQIDFYLVSNTTRIAVECKLTEKDIGICDPTAKGEAIRAYSRLPAFEVCNRVRYNGARYWEFLPEISNTPFPFFCPERCPLYKSYQLARNVMAAVVDPVAERVDSQGTALLLYDARNPCFKAAQGTPDILRSTQELLRDPSLLCSASWQSLAGLLGSTGRYEELLIFLKDKYGIMPEGSPGEGSGSSPLTICLDADPINEDWIKVVHWDRILSRTKDLDGFRSHLRSEGFTPEEFRGLHYFALLAEKHPWLKGL